jgi:nicotinate-nucleotide--dimethylbenzimidazole phosphoribosyltransferase
MQLPKIPPIDANAYSAALARQSILTKPAGALGQLEALSCALAGMTGRFDWLPERRAVVVCAGDHGVVAQGVSAYPQSVTAQMVLNFLDGGAAVNVLARQMGARVTVLDAGIARSLTLTHPDFIAAKIAPGTADFTVQPAMTHEQAEGAVVLGMQIAARELERGLDILAVGEMGIGNTTAASAIIAAITGQPPERVTGRGTGIGEAQLARKIEVISQALALHAPAGKETLAKLGGFEIGAMAGLMIAGAAARVPVVMDGLISTAAALIAVQLQPDVSHYLIASHRSAEPGHIAALQHLGLTPLLDLGLRLGEGTGALLALPLIEAAMRTLQEMATFGDAGVDGPV